MVVTIVNALLYGYTLAAAHDWTAGAAVALFLSEFYSLFSCGLFLAAGTKGKSGSNLRECMILGVTLLVVAAITILARVISGAGVSRFSALVEIMLPALYLAGVVHTSYARKAL